MRALNMRFPFCVLLLFFFSVSLVYLLNNQRAANCMFSIAVMRINQWQTTDGISNGDCMTVISTAVLRTHTHTYTPIYTHTHILSTPAFTLPTSTFIHIYPTCWALVDVCLCGRLNFTAIACATSVQRIDNQINNLLWVAFSRKLRVSWDAPFFHMRYARL